MPLVKVVVKWSGKDIEVEIDTSENAEVFKSQLFSLTSVPPDRQKILYKGRNLADNTDLDSLNLQEGNKFMMIGSPGDLPREPENKPLFLEDMSDKQLAETLKLPSGLKNLGNTCYLNSTLQCLRTIPELQESLNKFTGGSSGSDNVTASLRDLYRNMNQTAESVSPMFFLQMFRNEFSQFAQSNAYGFMQQDAEECWTQIITSLKQSKVPTPDQGSNSSSDSGASSSTVDESFIDRYMTGEFTATLKCTEAPEEQETVTKEKFLKLDCHINVHVNYVQYGIMEALDSEFTKESPTLGRNSKYSKSLRVSRLPMYLTVHFVRFFWKSETGVKAKILRRVKFPLELDASEFCTEELKNKFLPLKQRLLELEKDKESLKKKAKLAKSDDQNVVDLNVDEVENSKELEEIRKLVDPELSKDVGCNVSGLYDLCAVLTHTGRSAESGHYIGWVRKENSEDWIKYDDDRVSIVSQEEILKLEGGGDWHIAYMLLYQSKKIA